MKKIYQPMDVKDLGAFKTLTSGSGKGDADSQGKNNNNSGNKGGK